MLRERGARSRVAAVRAAAAAADDDDKKRHAPPSCPTAALQNAYIVTFRPTLSSLATIGRLDRRLFERARRCSGKAREHPSSRPLALALANRKANAAPLRQVTHLTRPPQPLAPLTYQLLRAL